MSGRHAPPGMVDSTSAPHRRLRFHGARLCQTRARPRGIHGHPARAAHAGGAAARLGNHLTELIGGFAVLIGAFVPLCSIPMAIVLFVAILTVHLPNGFSSIKLLAITPTGAHFGQPGYETDLLYLACLAALVLGGS